ncbi:hypothetical protein Desku_0841 [Desulfofundulus kuznetsovii DSM 6115]|uniref:Uncharacterized protein n=1 Tax=Desulfofundulus kuznetsovii (strain DSM 6115 / VKM B-1805 / 17) TaxID=760568 RepID=A0AAU8PRZ0_DESK7|nr:hypothetical protein Desku_0841 [Desulfofundulus kuznetsovii DSM 6115]
MKRRITVFRKKMTDIGVKAGAKMAAAEMRMKELLRQEKGSLDQLVWVVGAAVVVVLIVVVFMTLAPSTAQDIWNSFINYAKGKFGI